MDTITFRLRQDLILSQVDSGAGSGIAPNPAVPHSGRRVTVVEGAHGASAGPMAEEGWGLWCSQPTVAGHCSLLGFGRNSRV